MVAAVVVHAGSVQVHGGTGGTSGVDRYRSEGIGSERVWSESTRVHGPSESGEHTVRVRAVSIVRVRAVGIRSVRAYGPNECTRTRSE